MIFCLILISCYTAPYYTWMLIESNSLSHFIATKDNIWQCRELAGRLQYRLQKDDSLFKHQYCLSPGVLQCHYHLMSQTVRWHEHAQLRHQRSSLSRTAHGLFAVLLDSQNLKLSITVTFKMQSILLGECVCLKADCTSFTVTFTLFVI